MVKRWIYLVWRWFKAHQPTVHVEVAVVLPERDAVVGEGYFFLPVDQLLRRFRGVDLSVLGVRWDRVNEVLKVVVRGTEIPACGGELVSTNPIHTDKELRDARCLSDPPAKGT